MLEQLPNQSWWVFSNRCAKPYRHRNIHVRPTSAEGFLRCMASANGVLCGAGFETPAEALYLGKSLMVVPGMVNSSSSAMRLRCSRWGCLFSDV